MVLIARRFAVLGEPTRLRLLLAARDRERSVGELVALTGATQANVSRHLHRLEESGLLSRRRAGVRVYYAIADPAALALCRLAEARPGCGRARGGGSSG